MTHGKSVGSQRDRRTEGGGEKTQWNLADDSCVFLSTAAKYGEHESLFSQRLQTLAATRHVCHSNVSGSFHSVRNLPVEENEKKETSEGFILSERAAGTCAGRLSSN